MTTDISFKNFHINTAANFKTTTKPDREPDYISMRWGMVSSRYWDIGEGVIRESNHWGGVASCQWNYEGEEISPNIIISKDNQGRIFCGYVSYEELAKVAKLRIELLCLPEFALKGKYGNKLRNDIKNKLTI